MKTELEIFENKCLNDVENTDWERLIYMVSGLSLDFLKRSEQYWNKYYTWEGIKNLQKNYK